RQCSSSLRVRVQLGDDNGSDVHRIAERSGLRLASLTDRGVHHEDDVVRVHSVGDLEHLLEERRLL
ncbi:hypothetical protein PFISCL1PPCAC_16930, partial [Pristionchus fissidentatus]